MAQWNTVLLILTLSFFLAVDADVEDKMQIQNHLGLGLNNMWLPPQFSSLLTHNPFVGEALDDDSANNFESGDYGHKFLPNYLNEGKAPQETVEMNDNDDGHGLEDRKPHKENDDDGGNNNNNNIFGGEEENNKGNVEKKGDFEITSRGEWELINKESGVSAMHINLLPTNKILVFDAKVYRISRLKLPEGAPCIQFFDDKAKQQKQDCFAHAMEYDIETNQVRPLELAAGDPWCSSGGLAPDGTLVSTGGFFDGAKTVRYFGGNECENCKMREYNNILKDERWYGSQQLLPNGGFIVVGGRRAFSYEFVPTVEGQQSKQPYFFPFLYETSDFDENNLYPFVHLSTDGNLFIFSNNRSVLLNPTTNKVLRTFPVLPGGSRNYPASGMSVLLPIDLSAEADNINNGVVKAEVLVCGGGLHNAFVLAETKKVFLPALNDCNRMVITDRKSNWETELMPSRRTMGDSLVLPNGQILFINGAMMGTASWWDADAPNYAPVLYSPEKPKHLRFRVLKASTIARMYHSSSAVLPSGKIWVAGSNTHDTYKDKDKYPTETRVEAFSPPYLDKQFAKYRPNIDEAASAKDLKYGESFETEFKVEDYENGLSKEDVKVTMYAPPFTTHGVSMGQRLVILKSDGIEEQKGGVYRIKLEAPPSAKIAPSGYYLLFVVNRGLPSPGMWVRIQ